MFCLLLQTSMIMVMYVAVNAVVSLSSGTIPFLYTTCIGWSEFEFVKMKKYWLVTNSTAVLLGQAFSPQPLNDITYNDLSYTR